MDEAARLITNPMPTGSPRDTPHLVCCRHEFWSVPPTDRRGTSALPEQAAGKRLQRRIQAHQGETAQFGLGGEKAIEWVAMGQWVAAGVQTVQERDRQQLKPLRGKQLGKILQQLTGCRKLAKAHLGGNLPAGGRTHAHSIGRLGDGRLSRWRQAIRLGQPPEQGVGIEQQLQSRRRRHGMGCSRPASSSSGRGSSNTSGGGRVIRPASTPGMRRAGSCSRGTRRARVLSLLLEPESQVRRISDALQQQATTDPVAAEVLQLIPTILINRFRDKSIPEICAMGGITLEDLSQSKAYQEILGLGEARGEARGEAKVTLRLLARRCGPLSDAITARIEALPLEQLEALAEALLDFTGPADLSAWLAAHS